MQSQQNLLKETVSQNQTQNTINFCDNGYGIPQILGVLCLYDQQAHERSGFDPKFQIAPEHKKEVSQ